MAIAQQKKILVLAQDILDFGLNPSDSLLVIPSEDHPDRYIVLEGNRRITALKVLENPDLISGAVSSTLVRQFKQLCEKYQEDPIEGAQCVIVELTNSISVSSGERRRISQFRNQFHDIDHITLRSTIETSWLNQQNSTKTRRYHENVC